MVIFSRHRLIGALLLTATALFLGACQNAVTVGAVNRCGTDVEVRADSVTDMTTHWVTVRAGGDRSVVDMGQSIKTLYVNVRTPGSERIRSFEVSTASLGKPPAGASYESQLALEGDRCP